MSERDFVSIRFPLYPGESGERKVDGNLTVVEPFVEQVRFFQVPAQDFLPLGTLNPQIRLGIRLPELGLEYGANTPREADPIRLYRALKILGRFDTFSTTPVHLLHTDLRDAYAAAGHNYPLRFHHHVRDRVTSIIGQEALGEILQMIPPNLMVVVANLHKSKVHISGKTLQREIAKGHIESNPLYERVIQETKRRRRIEKQLARRICKMGFSLIA